MKKNIKTVIGLLIAFIIGISTTVTATTVFNSKDITYSSTATTKKNVKDSLDELYTKANTPWECAQGYICGRPLSIVKVGDYINMTPTNQNYSPPSSLTGYTGTNGNLWLPELKLWKVIKKNDDGTVDVVSEYVSTQTIAFKGKTGYMNFIGVLNTIAAQYTNDKYVLKTRHFGYNDQVENCSSFSISSCPGDSEWAVDNATIGMIKKTTPSGNYSGYWVASRDQWSDSYGGVYVEPDNNGKSYKIFVVGSTDKDPVGASVLPVLTFKSDILIKSGEGTKASPYQLV